MCALEPTPTVLSTLRPVFALTSCVSLSEQLADHLVHTAIRARTASRLASPTPHGPPAHPRRGNRAQPDPTYSWYATGFNMSEGTWNAYLLNLTSGTWLSPADSDR